MAYAVLRRVTLLIRGYTLNYDIDKSFITDAKRMIVRTAYQPMSPLVIKRCGKILLNVQGTQIS